VTETSFASAAERRFAARPHVGAVTHFEGLDVPDTAQRVRALLDELGLAPEVALEQAHDRQLFTAVAALPGGDGMELWLVVTPQPAVGCKVEMRVYHADQDSASADEYLASLARRLVGPSA
jgi:hypothetical protein